MVALVAAVALAPWAHPPHFRPLPGWHLGSGGTFESSYGPNPAVASPKESTAWMVKGVRYRDRRTADPPTATLAQLPRDGIVVFAVVYQGVTNASRPIALRLDRSNHYPCCDGTYVPGGEYSLTGAGPGAAYSVIVRVYFGRPPTRSMLAQAQRALDRLELPAPRSRRNVTDAGPPRRRTQPNRRIRLG
jgi:hypothetical protein